MQELYGGIIIPEAVKLELTGVDTPVAGATEVQTQNWIQTRSVVNQELVTTLRLEIDEGEAEAIALAIELNAQLPIIISYPCCAMLSQVFQEIFKLLPTDVIK